MTTKLAALLLISIFGHTAQADTITLVADEWCPFNCTPGAEPAGYMIDVAKKIFEAQGHKVEYKTMNWARAIKDSRDGKYAGIIAAYQEDAPDFIYPTSELGLNADTFYVKKGDNWTYQGIDSLSGIVLALIKDYAYAEPIAGYVKKYQNDPAKLILTAGDEPLKRNLELVQKQRARATIESSLVVRYQFGQNPSLAESFQQAGHLEMQKLYIGFSPKGAKSKAYAEILDQGIKNLRRNGTLAEILRPYNLPDWAG